MHEEETSRVSPFPRGRGRVSAAPGVRAPRGHRVAGTLPAGVRILDLAGHADGRGRLTELYRQDWWPLGPARQWNLVTSRCGVMRGVHVHTRAAEYYALLEGRAIVGYRDVRRGSPTLGQTAVVEILSGSVIIAPPGLAHGVYARDAYTLLVGTTTVHDPAAELGCHWQDPDLRIPWPFAAAVVSRQDASRGRLADLLPLVPAYPGDARQD
jgi:dTDP-4-dehydrorhamnose 3,5-epimerase-like enzyme